MIYSILYYAFLIYLKEIEILAFKFVTKLVDMLVSWYLLYFFSFKLL